MRPPGVSTFRRTCFAVCSAGETVSKRKKSVLLSWSAGILPAGSREQLEICGLEVEPVD